MYRYVVNNGVIRLSAVIVLAMVCNFSHAQTWPFEMWHEGKVVLAEGDTLKGMIKYDLRQDLIQYAYKDNQAEVFTARKVLFFEIFDNTVHQYRQFFVLPYTTPAGYKSPVFFELLEEGKMTLLAREQLEYRTVGRGYYSYNMQVLAYSYFLMKEDGTIEEFRGKKNDLLDLMGKKADAVSKFMKANRLKFDDKEDIKKIVAYYNSLFNT